MSHYKADMNEWRTTNAACLAWRQVMDYYNPVHPSKYIEQLKNIVPLIDDVDNLKHIFYKSSVMFIIYSYNFKSILIEPVDRCAHWLHTYVFIEETNITSWLYCWMSN